MRNKDDYRFLRLADATTALNQRVNLIGIIVEYGTPTRSKGTGIHIQSLFSIFPQFDYSIFETFFGGDE